jgi:hypothetical protein
MDNVGVMMRSIGTAAGATRTEAKLQALSWLAAQLEWERTLGAFRSGESDAESRAALRMGRLRLRLPSGRLRLRLR